MEQDAANRLHQAIHGCSWPSPPPAVRPQMMSGCQPVQQQQPLNMQHPNMLPQQMNMQPLQFQQQQHFAFPPPMSFMPHAGLMPQSQHVGQIPQQQHHNVLPQSMQQHVPQQVQPAAAIAKASAVATDAPAHTPDVLPAEAAQMHDTALRSSLAKAPVPHVVITPPPAVDQETVTVEDVEPRAPKRPKPTLATPPGMGPAGGSKAKVIVKAAPPKSKAKASSAEASEPAGPSRITPAQQERAEAMRFALEHEQRRTRDRARIMSQQTANAIAVYRIQNRAEIDRAMRVPPANGRISVETQTVMSVPPSADAMLQVFFPPGI